MYRILILMDPGAVPVSLETIDEKISSFVERQDAARKKTDQQIEAAETQRKELLTRVQAHDDQLKDQKEVLAEVQGKVTSIRFNAGDDHGSDQLRNALPDDVRSWIPRVKTLSLADLGDADASPRTKRALVRQAKADPILFCAIAAWFQTRIKQFLAARGGNPDLAAKWHKRANDLAKAMGGFDELQLRTLRQDGASNLDPFDRVEKADLAEGTDALGGYLVPVITEAMIAAMMIDASVVRNAGAFVLQMTATRHELPNLATDFTGATADLEGNTIPDAAPASPFGSGNLVAFRRAGTVGVTIELIQDSLINIMSFVMERMTRREGRWEDTQLLEGDGTIITGLFSASGVVSVAGGSAAMDVIKWGKLVHGAEEAETIDNGVVFSHPWAIRDLLTVPLKDATNNLAMPFQWAVNLAQTGLRQQSLGGVPIHKTAGILRNRGGGTNETTLYHGDPSYIVIGDRMGITFDVNPWGDADFTKGKVRLRLLRRVGGLIWLPTMFTKLTAITVS